jgi:hypothetical protein
LAQGIIDAFAPLAKACVEAAQIFAESLEDAMRDNSLHPTGPVVRSTAFPLPNDAPKIPVIPMIAEEAQSFQEYRENEKGIKDCADL